MNGTGREQGTCSLAARKKTRVPLKAEPRVSQNGGKKDPPPPMAKLKISMGKGVPVLSQKLLWELSPTHGKVKSYYGNSGLSHYRDPHTFFALRDFSVRP
jgi:hypothetical protein